MSKEQKSIPGMTQDIYREFMEEWMKCFVEDSREQIVKTFKDRTRCFAYEITDMDSSFYSEITDDGDCNVSWEPTGKTGISYIADAATLDEMMTARMSPAEAFIRGKVKVKGPVGQVIRFLPVFPCLQEAYVKARKGITEKYELYEYDKEYPVPDDFEERIKL